MARCPHNNVQQFTECCLDCGRNIYESDTEYYQHLKDLERQQMNQARSEDIERLENKLGIKHPGNNQPNYDDCGGW